MSEVNEIPLNNDAFGGATDAEEEKKRRARLRFERKMNARKKGIEAKRKARKNKKKGGESPVKEKVKKKVEAPSVKKDDVVVNDKPPANFDERPIGGGNKPNNFDERPIGGGNKQPNFDERPIGGGSKPNDFDERPIGGGNKQPNFDERPIGGGSKQPNFDERPIGGGAKPNNFDEKPISGGAKPNNFDEQPIGGGSKRNNFDEQPIGGSGNPNPPKEGEAEEEIVIPTGSYNIDFDKLDLNAVNPFGGGGGGINPFGGNGGGINPFGGNGGGIGGNPGGGMPEIKIETEEELRAGPLKDRVFDKNIKKRMYAYEEMEKIAEENISHEIFTLFEDKHWAKAISEVNPIALEHGLKLSIAYLENGGKLSVSTMMQKLVEKALTQIKRKNIIDTSNELLSKFFSINPEATMSQINKAINHRTPKVSNAAFQAISYLADENGPQKLDLFRPFIDNAIKATINAKKKIEAMNFFKDGVRWIGQNFVSLVSGLKKQLQIQLEDFAKKNPNPTKTKKSKKKKKKKKVVEVEESSEEESEEEGAGLGLGSMDPYDLAKPYDIFKQYNEAWSEKVIASSKWQDRKKWISEFIDTGEKKLKFVNSDSHHINQMIKKIFMETNQMVHIVTIKMIGVIAFGLRRKWRDGAKHQVPMLIHKLKEKNMVIRVINETLDKLFYCIGIEEVMDDVEEGLKHKKPSVKINTYQWVINYLKKPDNIKKSKSIGGKLFPITDKLIKNGDPKIRDKAMEFMGMLKAFTNNHFEKNMKGVTGAKMKKVNKFAEKYKAEMNKSEEKEEKPEEKSPQKKSKPKKKESPSPQKKSRKTKKQRKRSEIESESEAQPSVEQTPLPSSNKKKRGRRRRRKALFSDDEDEGEEEEETPKKIRGKKKNILFAQTKADRLSSPRYTLDEVHDTFFDIEFPQSIIDNLSSVKWRKKYEGIKEMFPWLIDNMEYSEHCMLLLYSETKDFAESNKKVNQAIFKILDTISDEVEDKKKLMVEPNVRLFTKLCVERMNDKHFSDDIRELIIRCCSTCKPQAIIATMLDYVNSKVLNPKMAHELTVFFNSIMPVLTPKYLPISDLLEFAKITLGSKNQTVRKIGIAIFCNLYMMLGDKVKDFLNDVSSGMMKTLEHEFAKRQINLKMIPTIEILGNKPKIVAPTEPVYTTNEVMPKANLKSELVNLIRSCKEPSWQKRREAFVEIMNLLKEANYSVKATGLDNLVFDLASKVDDNHKSVLKAGLRFIGEFARSLGSSFKQYSNAFIPILIKHIQNRQEIRKISIDAFHEIYNSVDSVLALNAMLDNLSIEKPEAKISICDFILERSENLPGCNFKQAAIHITEGLSNRNKQIRRLSELLLREIIPHSGDRLFRAQTNKMNELLKQKTNDLIDSIVGVEKKSPEQVSRNTSRPPSRGKSREKRKSRLNSERSKSRKSRVSHHDIPPTTSGFDPEIKNVVDGAIPLAGIYRKYSHDPSKLIYKSDDKKIRIADKWNFLGPSDRDLELFYERMRNHFNPKLLKKMFSVEVSKVQEGIKQLLQIFQNNPEDFLNVQDLTLQWIIVRSFENRPQIAAFYLDFLAKLFRKYSGASFFSEAEKEYLGVCCINLYTNCSQFIAEDLFSELIGLTVRQTGEKMFIDLVMKNILENSMVQKYYTPIMVSIITAIMAETGGRTLLKKEYIAILEKLCYNLQSEVRMKVVLIVKNLYTINPGLVSQNIQSHDNQLIAAVEHLIQQGGVTQPPSMAIQPQMNAGYSMTQSQTIPPSVNVTKQTEPEFVEDKQLEEYNNEEYVDTEANSNYEDEQESGFFDEELEDVSGQVANPQLLDQVDAYIKNILDVEDEYALQYLKYMKTWVRDKQMEDYIVVRSNWILIKTIKLIQEISIQGIDLQKANYYDIVFDIIKGYSENQYIMDELEENTLFDLIDTCLLLLLGANDVKAMTRKGSSDFDYLVELIDTMNALMLSIMDSADSNSLYNVLFDLLIKSQTEMVHEKLKGLTVKCLVRHAKAMEKHKNQVDLGNILYKMHQYILEVSGNKSQELGVKAIKTVIKKIVDLVGEAKIYEAYSTVENSGQEDTCIKHWIEIVVKNLKKEQAKKEEEKRRRNTTLAQQKNYANYNQSKPRRSEYHQNNGYGQIHRRQYSQPGELSHNQSFTSNTSHSDSNVIKIVQKFQGGNLRSFPKIIYELHCEMLQQPRIKIENYLTTLSKNHAKYILKELKRHQERENVKPEWSSSEKHNNSHHKSDRFYGSRDEYNSRSNIKDSRDNLISPYYRSQNQGSDHKPATDPKTNEMMKRLASMREKMRDYLHPNQN